MRRAESVGKQPLGRALPMAVIGLDHVEIGRWRYLPQVQLRGRERAAMPVF